MTNRAFGTAMDSRKRARDFSSIHTEIVAIEGAIITSVDSGLLTVDINDTTYTTSNDYYLVWTGSVSDRTKLDQLNYVQQHFLNLGYITQLLTDSGTGNTLLWRISW